MFLLQSLMICIIKAAMQREEWDDKFPKKKQLATERRFPAKSKWKSANKITVQQTDDVLFTERTRAVLNEPAIHTATVKFMDTRQHTNPLKWTNTYTQTRSRRQASWKLLPPRHASMYACMHRWMERLKNCRSQQCTKTQLLALPIIKAGCRQYRSVRKAGLPVRVPQWS